MKRHPALQPFSRDHNVGLILARSMVQAADNFGQRPDVIQSLTDAWRLELDDHFQKEELLLLPLCSKESSERMQSEHAELRSLFEDLIAGSKEADVFRLAGEGLDSHIRWEERELFCQIEASASPEQLDELAKRTWIPEETRWESGLAPRREELMKRIVRTE